jgi:hypothetical protein
MKLFFLLIPFLGINCFTNCLQEKKKTASVQHHVVSSYQMQSALLIQF